MVRGTGWAREELAAEEAAEEAAALAAAAAAEGNREAAAAAAAVAENAYASARRHHRGIGSAGADDASGAGAGSGGSSGGGDGGSGVGPTQILPTTSSTPDRRFEPSFLERKWHPVTWRVLSNSPYGGEMLVSALAAATLAGLLSTDPARRAGAARSLAAALARHAWDARLQSPAGRWGPFPFCAPTHPPPPPHSVPVCV